VTELAERIRSALASAADPGRAPAMQAYMKSTVPFLGVARPVVRRLTREQLAACPPADEAELLDTVRCLWVEQEFREQRYAAADLLNTPVARRWASPTRLPVLAELIVDVAWWDHVDELAHRVGDVRRAEPATVAPTLRQWSRQPDRWLRRAAVICQLGHRRETDTRLLSDAIEASAAEPDFFLRKAIGWALRDYSRTDPDWVRAFVATHRLSPLSVREALKHL